MTPAATNPYCNPTTLMRLFQAGSPEALDRITRCYGERLLAAGRRHCRTPDEAQDAVQDALLAAASRGDSFRAEGSLEGWLVRIVANACHRLARGRKNDPARHDSQVVLRGTQPSPYDLSCRGQLSQRLQAALLELSPTDRLVLVLAEIEEWSAPEIAAEIGISAGAVRTRLSRLRARMRDTLATLGSDADD